MVVINVINKHDKCEYYYTSYFTSILFMWCENCQSYSINCSKLDSSNILNQLLTLVKLSLNVIDWQPKNEWQPSLEQFCVRMYGSLISNHWQSFVFLFFCRKLKNLITEVKLITLLIHLVDTAEIKNRSSSVSGCKSFSDIFLSLFASIRTFLGQAKFSISATHVQPLDSSNRGI